MVQDNGSSLNIIERYLDEMVRQHETVFACLEGLDEDLVWKRPAPREWCIGENLDHARALYSSMLPLFQISWTLLKPVAWLRRERPYPVEIDNVYCRPKFPNQVGALLPSRYSPRNSTSLLLLKEEIARDHQQVILFYRGKPEELLGNTYLFDPAIGWLNLIQALRVGLYHDQMHYAAVQNILKQKSIDCLSGEKDGCSSQHNLLA